MWNHLEGSFLWCSRQMTEPESRKNEGADEL